MILDELASAACPVAEALKWELRTDSKTIGHCSLDRATRAIARLASRHGRRWSDAAWMSSDGVRPVGERDAMALGQLQTRGTQAFIEKFGDELTADDVETLRAVATATPRWLMTRSELEIPFRPDRAAPHLFLADSWFSDADAATQSHGAASGADQPPLRWEHPLREVASFLATCLEPDVLRHHELRLVAHYHAILVANGVDYTLDSCLDDYRLGQLAAPVSTMTALALESSPSPTVRKRIVTEVKRSSAAIRELRSLSLVTGRPVGARVDLVAELIG